MNPLRRSFFKGAGLLGALAAGVATTKAASTITVARKTIMLKRYGRANLKIRLTVPGFNFCSFTEGSAVIERWVIHAACMDIIKR